MSLAKGQIIEASGIDGRPGCLMLVIKVDGREIYQITTADVRAGGEVDIDLETTRIYRNDVDVTYESTPVTITGTVQQV